MSDRLALANAIEDAGIERGKAQRIASVIFDAIHDTVATKADVLANEAALKAELHRMEAGFKTETNRIEYSLKAEITQSRDWLMIRGIGALATGLAALFAALHYWPPHG